MSHVDSILIFMKDKGNVSLDEIYKGTNLKPHVVRAVLNMNVKKGQVFERTARGRYALKNGN